MSDEAEINESNSEKLSTLIGVIEPDAGSKAQARARDEVGRYKQERRTELRAQAEQLDRDMDKYLPAGQDEDEPEADAKAKEPAAKTDEPTEADGSEEGEADAAKKPDERKVKELDKARKAILLNGLYDADDLKTMSEDQLLKLGAKATENNRKRSEERAEAKRLSTGAPEADQKREPAEKPLSPTREKIQATVKGLEETYGPELSRPIAELLEAVHADSEDRIARLEAAHTESQYRSAKEALRERFPQVDSPEGDELLIAKMRKLGASYEDMNELARDSAWLLWGEEVAKKAGAARHELRVLKQAGQPRVSARTTGSAKPRTFSDRLDAALDAAMKPGGGKRDVEEAFGS